MTHLYLRGAPAHRGSPHEMPAKLADAPTREPAVQILKEKPRQDAGGELKAICQRGEERGRDGGRAARPQRRHDD